MLTRKNRKGNIAPTIPKFCQKKTAPPKFDLNPLRTSDRLSPAKSYSSVALLRKMNSIWTTTTTGLLWCAKKTCYSYEFLMNSLISLYRPEKVVRPSIRCGLLARGACGTSTRSDEALCE